MDLKAGGLEGGGEFGVAEGGVPTAADDAVR